MGLPAGDSSDESDGVTISMALVSSDEDDGDSSSTSDDDLEEIEEEKPTILGLYVQDDDFMMEQHAQATARGSWQQVVQ